MSVLRQIFDLRHEDLEKSKAEVSLQELRAQCRDQEPPRGFIRSLLNHARPIGLIAEVKPASPSQGPINLGLDPARLAKEYEQAGAHCLSVLTENRHFGGSAENLMAAKHACSLPVLRKDFIDEPYQIWEARAWGADAILLIVAALDYEQVWELQHLAVEIGMDVLVEVHNQAELEIAQRANAELIGVNSRDLATLKTDLAVAEALLPRIGSTVISVAESALATHADVERVRKAGAKAVLIGTAFCEAPDVGAKVREAMAW